MHLQIALYYRLYLKHDFGDVIFKIKHKLYVASVSASFTLTESWPTVTLMSAVLKAESPLAAVPTRAPSRCPSRLCMNFASDVSRYLA